MLEWLGHHPLGLSLEKLRSWNRNYEEPFSLGKTHRTSLTSPVSGAHTLGEERPCHHPPCYLFSLFHVEEKVGLNSIPDEVIQFKGEGTRYQFGVIADIWKEVAGLSSVNLSVLWFEQLSEQTSSCSIFLKHSSIEFASKYFIILILTTNILTLEFMILHDFNLDCGYHPICQCTHLVRQATTFILQGHHASNCIRLRRGPCPLLIPVPLFLLAPGECCSHSAKGHLHNRALLIDLKTCKICPSPTLFICDLSIYENYLPTTLWEESVPHLPFAYFI